MAVQQRILVPIDGSDASCRAVELAATFARALRAEITLLHVFEHKPKEDMSLAAFERGERWLGELSAERRHEHGDAAAKILAIAREEAFDQIVMGSRGLSPLGEQLLGGVSERVVQHARCPVTVVH